MKERIKATITWLKSLDYRHYINVIITLGFIACGVFIFPNAIARFAESVRDFGTSCAYTICEWILEENPVTPTVNNVQSWQIVSSQFAPLTLFPFTWEEFTAKWSSYWVTFFHWKTLLQYLLFLLEIIPSVVYVLLFGIGIGAITYKLFKWYLKKQNNAYDRESRAVRITKRISDYTYQRAKKWVAEYICFLKENTYYLKIWGALWLFYFNAFAITVDFVAYYVYLLGGLDFLSLYRQLYKFMLDLTTVVRFVPAFVWVFCVFGLLEYQARQIGYKRLEHRERRNCGFLDERGVVTIVYGPMGAGKTKLITDMALSEETRMRDDAFEIIIESDFKFPNMNWATLEQDLKAAIGRHKVYSIATVRKWLRKKYRAWRRNPCPEKIWNYDYKRYGLTYDDNLKVSNIWQVIDDYACAYFIYTIQSSLLIANYSIRVDNLMEDIGNFPRWNTSFFRRDSRLMDSYSRHAHILDFDMLRLGKRLVEDNPNRYAFGFGVYVISEIDKERKNDKELREQGVKADAPVANQKNDLFNTLLKMSRHACVVANRVFIKVFADLQRPESLGADARELGEIHYIEDKGEMDCVLPFFAPFYLLETLFAWTFDKFVKLYYDYRFTRSDKTLPMYAAKNLSAWIKRIRERTCNLYGSSTVKLKVESGRMDGQTIDRVYFLQSKKIYSNRYATDCLSGIFEQYAEKNTIGINDLPEYVGIMASDDELLMQNSFFQLEVRGYGVAA